MLRGDGIWIPSLYNSSSPTFGDPKTGEIIPTRYDPEATAYRDNSQANGLMLVTLTDGTKNQSSCKQSTEHHASSCSSAAKCKQSVLYASEPRARATAPAPTGSTEHGRSPIYPAFPETSEGPPRNFATTPPPTKSPTRHRAPAPCESSPKPITHSVGCLDLAKTPNRCTITSR